MNKLSVELVEQIASHLDAGDAMSLSTVCRVARVGSLSRLSPERYLQRTFKDARLLLTAMMDHGCVLSGSRALEYFVPGSLEGPSLVREQPAEAAAAPPPDPSDWDFLVPCLKSSVIGMMDALGKSGVDWGDPLADIMALPGKPVGTVAYVRGKSVFHLPPLTLQELRDPLAPMTDAMTELYQALYDFILDTLMVEANMWIAVHVVPKSAAATLGYWFEVVRMDDADDYGYAAGQYDLEDGVRRPVCFVNGTIRMGRQTAKVQLFQCHLADHQDATPLEYIVSSYYASHVQCFLAGWCAGHFYFDLARHHTGLVWEPDVHRRGRERQLAKCLAKYERRGFSFVRAREAVRGRGTGALDAASAAAVRQAVQPASAGHLGQPGTLLVRFAELQSQMIDMAVESRIEPHSPTRQQAQERFRQLNQSISRFRVSGSKTRPVAIEPRMPQLHRIDMPASADHHAVPGPAAVGGSAKPYAILRPDTPAWRRLDMLLHLAPETCRFQCGPREMYKPPQV